MLMEGPHGESLQMRLEMIGQEPSQGAEQDWSIPTALPIILVNRMEMTQALVLQELPTSLATLCRSQGTLQSPVLEEATSESEHQESHGDEPRRLVSSDAPFCAGHTTP